MSLSIHIIRDEPNGEYTLEEEPYGIFNGVGTERLWTAPVIRELGASYLPQVGDGYLRIRPEETGAFLRECANLLVHASEITAATLGDKTQPEQEDYVERNLSIMIYMTYHARRNDHGVLIW